jgi:hemoglobin-like flavoprotein
MSTASKPAAARPSKTDVDRSMTPQQIELVQHSFAKVAPIAQTAADLFYDRLFAIAPEVQQLFPDDLTEQKQKLMQMLAMAVGNLNRVDTILGAVEDLGRRHATYGVTAAYYAPVGAALLWTLQQGLGDAFTPSVREAWGAAYSMLAGAMIGAAEASAAPDVG